MDSRNILIGERVRFYRIKNDLTLAQVASMLEKPCSHQLIARLETGKGRWFADTLAELSLILEIDARILMGLEDAVKTKPLNLNNL